MFVDSLLENRLTRRKLWSLNDFSLTYKPLVLPSKTRKRSTASDGHVMCWNSSRNSADCSFESHFDCEHSSQSDFAFVFGHKEPGVVEAAEDSPSKMFFKDHF